MDPYMLSTYNYKYNQYLHSGCTADVAAAEALRSVRSFYGHKANNQEFLNYVNRVSNTLSANGQVNTTQSTAAGIGYQYNPHYGMVPSHISNIYYGSHPNVDTTAMYNQQLLSQSNSACSSNALLSGISIKPPSIPKPQAPPSVPIHPSQYKQQSNAAQNHAKLPKDVNTANTSSAITDWVYKIFSVHVTEKSSKKWNMAVTNFLNHKIDYWKSHNITPTPVDLMIPSADVIESYSAQHGHNSKQIVPLHNNTNSSIPLDTSTTSNISSSESKNGMKNDKKGDKKSSATNFDKYSKTKLDSFMDIDTTGVKKSLKYKSLLQKRAERFTKGTKGVIAEINLTQQVEKLIGTSTDMEKQYLRLTGPPNPSLVRPIHVLKKSFIYVLEKYKKTLNYRYIQEQFRSIRQDMKVQHINDLFATHVYETNARIALLNCDLDQFNQCQTQLIDLHSINQVAPENKIEFKCYRLLYLALQNTKMDLLRYLKELNNTSDKSLVKYIAVIDYANKLRRIVEDENFYRYFSLIKSETRRLENDLDYIYDIATEKLKVTSPKDCEKEPPFFSRYLFKMFNQKFRVLYLLTMAKTSIIINPKSVYTQFRFDSCDEFKSFLNELNIVWTSSGSVDCKQSLPKLLESRVLKSKKIEQ